MKKNSFYGYVYVIRNIQTNQYYVGSTTKTVSERIKDHLQKANSGSPLTFHRALREFALDKFCIELIETVNSIEELARVEKLHIKIFNSLINGYNSDSGGGFLKPVYQYSTKSGKLLNSFDCLESAAKAVNSTVKKLSKACIKENYKVKNSFWSYNYKEKFQAKNDRRKKIVLQLDIENNIVNKFNSVAEASRVTGVFKSNIAKVCRGERNHAGGYRWIYRN